MIKVVSIESMRNIEQAADKSGISFATMFERVALAVAGHIADQLKTIPEPRVAILVGSGNNGGDGLVTAQQLAQHENIEIGVYLVKSRSEDDAMLKAIRDTDIFVAEAEHDQQYRVLRNLVASADIVVDAILGIGTHLPLEGELAKIMQNIHQALNLQPITPDEGELISPDNIETHTHIRKPYVIALDCPSGVNCDTGETDKVTINADETITFIAVKQGLLMAPAAGFVGKLRVATLGIPENLPSLKTEPINYVQRGMVKNMLPPRPHLGHKGTFGKAMIVAGSVNYTGAAGLAAAAAYRSGVGLVTVAAPMPVVAGLASQFLEPTWILLPHDMGVISENAADVITKEIDGYNALLIGPGLAQEETTREMLIKLFSSTGEKIRPEKRSIGFNQVKHDEKLSGETNKKNTTIQLPPLVLDADALNLLAKIDNWTEIVPRNSILTPHPGEMARLCNLPQDEVINNKFKLAQEKAKEWNMIVLLKGAHTVIAAPDGQTAILPFKTAALSTAGTGDVLAGIIVSLLAQGAEPFAAAITGGYLHGSAGIMAERIMGSSHGVIASDILDLVGDVLGDLANH